jgi:hypothetical protein
MDSTSRPTKEQIREYMRKRSESSEAPPDLKEIRRQLGWDLVELARQERKRRGK